MILLFYSICVFFPYGLLIYYYKVLALPQMDKYVSRTFIGILLLDYMTKFIAAVMLSEDIIDDDGFGLFVMYVPIVTCLIIFVLNKLIGPKVDARKIKKLSVGRKMTLRRFLCLLLLILNPFITTELYLMACGFNGICDFYERIPYLQEQLDCKTAIEIEQFGMGLFFLLIIYIVIVLLAVISIFRQQNKRNNVITLSKITTSTSPILFLRSFELNKSTLSNRSFDEHLCNGFPIKDQPVISLADPDVAFAEGTIKIQAEDSSWKDAIIKLFERSKAVIMFEGKSDGLNWEIDNIKKYIPYDRFFIATPPDDYRTVAWVTGNSYASASLKFQVWWAQHFTKRSIKYAYNYIWKRFSERLSKVGIVLPTEQPGSGCLISFDERWDVKDIYRGLVGQDFFNKVISLIPNDRNDNFDYEVLQKSIDEFEVKGQITPDIEKRCKRFSNWILLSQVLLFVTIIIICVNMFL